MKNRFSKKMLIAIAIALVVGIYTSKKQSSTKTSSLLLDNVEALAYGESDNMWCFGVRSVDCPINHIKVFSYETASRLYY